MVGIPRFDTLNNAVSARFPGKTIDTGADEPQSAGIHLYHAPNSICSQKVRAVLFATNQPFVSHQIDIFKGETYDPHYVRLRVAACEASGHRLADDHPGTTSVASTGCDSCVVPTVVIPQSQDVLIDSKNICIKLAQRQQGAAPTLLPSALTADIDQELAIVDDLPNYQMLAVTTGKAHTGGADNSFALSKVRRCDDLMAKYPDDAELRRGYSAKRAKEQSAADRLFDDEAMTRGRKAIGAALRDLDDRLRRRASPFLFGATPTMADLFWGVELIRLIDLGGLNQWTGGHTQVLDDYSGRTSEYPAVFRAVTDWPGARLRH